MHTTHTYTQILINLICGCVVDVYWLNKFANCHNMLAFLITEREVSIPLLTIREAKLKWYFITINDLFSSQFRKFQSLQQFFFGLLFNEGQDIQLLIQCCNSLILDIEITSLTLEYSLTCGGQLSLICAFCLRFSLHFVACFNVTVLGRGRRVGLEVAAN